MLQTDLTFLACMTKHCIASAAQDDVLFLIHHYLRDVHNGAAKLSRLPTNAKGLAKIKTRCATVLSLRSSCGLCANRNHASCCGSVVRRLPLIPVRSVEGVQIKSVKDCLRRLVLRLDVMDAMVLRPEVAGRCCASLLLVLLHRDLHPIVSHTLVVGA